MYLNPLQQNKNVEEKQFTTKSRGQQKLPVRSGSKKVVLIGKNKTLEREE